MYKIRDNEKVLALMMANENRIWNWFQNNFDESKDNKSETAKYKYLEAVKNLISFCFAKYKDEKEGDSFKATKEVYSVLRLIRFIKGFDDEK
jgi:hypothetical protein